MEIVTDSLGSQKGEPEGAPEHDPVDSLARSGLRARLRLK